MSTPENRINTGEAGNNTANGGTATTPTEEKTFTQAELNAIIGERLAKEKAKAEAALATREQELAQREFQFAAQKTLTDRGFSMKLLDALNVSSPEAFEKSLSIITELYGDPKTPRPTLQITGPANGLPLESEGALMRDAFGLNRRG